jgi:hypothetical protein
MKNRFVVHLYPGEKKTLSANEVLRIWMKHLEHMWVHIPKRNTHYQPYVHTRNHGSLFCVIKQVIVAGFQCA